MQRELTKAASDAIIAVLRPHVEHNPALTVKALPPEMFDTMATAAVSGWVKRRSEIKELADDLNDDISDIGL